MMMLCKRIATITAVLSGISALADLRLDDGRPMFSFNLDPIRDSAVV